MEKPTVEEMMKQVEESVKKMVTDAIFVSDPEPWKTNIAKFVENRILDKFIEAAKKQKQQIKDHFSPNICLLCNEPIEENEDAMIVEVSGPFGLGESEEIGQVHTECHRQFFEEDEE